MISWHFWSWVSNFEMMKTGGFTVERHPLWLQEVNANPKMAGDGSSRSVRVFIGRKVKQWTWLRLQVWCKINWWTEKEMGFTTSIACHKAFLLFTTSLYKTVKQWYSPACDGCHRVESNSCPHVEVEGPDRDAQSQIISSVHMWLSWTKAKRLIWFHWSI